MIITICGSMVFAKEMMEVKEKLEEQGHVVLVPRTAYQYLDIDSVSGKEQQAIHNKNENDAIRDHYELIVAGDAILVLNYEKRGVPNYVGGNTLLEIGYAYILRKKFFLLNPVPEIPYYQSEIEACRPIILEGDLSKIC